MNRRSFEAQDGIRRRLTDKLIAKPTTAEGKADGCTAIVSAFFTVLAPLLGNIGTNAVLRRASALAQQRHLLLASLVVTETGLDDDQLRAEVRDKDPDHVATALAGLVDTLFEVLDGLLGDTSLPVLRELVAELVAMGRISPERGESS